MDISSIYRGLVEHAPMPMAMLEGEHHVIRHVNPAFRRLMSARGGQPVGQCFRQCFPRGDMCQALLDRVFDGSIAEGQIEETPFESDPVLWTFTVWPLVTDLRPAGTIVCQMTAASPSQQRVFDLNEALMLGVVRQHKLTEASECLNAALQLEIAHRKSAELALLLLAAIIESSDDAIISEDLTGTLTSWNRGAERIFGYAAREVVGGPTLQMVPAGLRAEEDQMLLRIMQGECIEHFETLRRTKDGRSIDVSITASAIKDSGGKVIGVSKVARNISERKAAEESIRQLNTDLERRVVARTLQLQVANEELGAFSYSVSHDLRAPLRHVLGFVTMLSEEAGATLSERSAGLLARISSAAVRMGTLIDDLLAFSRLGSAELRKSKLSLDCLVREVLEDLQEEIKGRSITWEIASMPEVCGDRALLKVVLTNLIANALKFTNTRPQAAIKIACAPSENSETVLFVQDNGVGFDPSYAHKLFGVFQRLHSQSEFEGTGIGLANVRRIVNRHGGRVWAEGVLGKGATFYLSIPKCE